jgi:hypothetical protein
MDSCKYNLNTVSGEFNPLDENTYAHAVTNPGNYNDIIYMSKSAWIRNQLGKDPLPDPNEHLRRQLNPTTFDEWVAIKALTYAELLDALGYKTYTDPLVSVTCVDDSDAGGRYPDDLGYFVAPEPRSWWSRLWR